MRGSVLDSLLTDLSDAEVRARLRNRGIDEDDVKALVSGRDDTHPIIERILDGNIHRHD